MRDSKNEWLGWTFADAAAGYCDEDDVGAPIPSERRGEICVEREYDRRAARDAALRETPAWRDSVRIGALLERLEPVYAAHAASEPKLTRDFLAITMVAMDLRAQLAEARADVLAEQLANARTDRDWDIPQTWWEGLQVEWHLAEKLGAAQRALEAAGESPTQLYRAFDGAGGLLYVGISLGALQRAQQHRQTAAWWPSACRLDIQHYPTRKAAMAAERVAIIKERPRFNVQHNTI